MDNQREESKRGYFYESTAEFRALWKKSPLKATASILGLSVIVLGVLLLKDSRSTSGSDVETLYKYWQQQNPSVPGKYLDKLMDGRIIHTCTGTGDWPAHFGWIEVKTEFDGVALPDSKPFKVYVGGVNWNGKRQWWIQPEETKGHDVLRGLAQIGCEIPASLRQ